MAQPKRYEGFLEAHEVMAQYGVTVSTLCQMRASGEVPHIRSGVRRFLYNEEGVRSYVARHGRGGTAEGDEKRRLNLSLVIAAFEDRRKRGQSAVMRKDIVDDLAALDLVASPQVYEIISMYEGKVFKKVSGKGRRYALYSLIEPLDESFLIGSEPESKPASSGAGQQGELGLRRPVERPGRHLVSVPSGDEPKDEAEPESSEPVFDGETLKVITDRPVPPKVKRDAVNGVTAQIRSMPFNSCVFFEDIGKGRGFAKMISSLGFSARTERADGGMYVYKIEKNKT